MQYFYHFFLFQVCQDRVCLHSQTITGTFGPTISWLLFQADFFAKTAGQKEQSLVNMKGTTRKIKY